MTLTKWQLISSNNTNNATGSFISTPGYNASNWMPITVPATVLDGLVQNDVYSNDKLYYSMNLKNISLEQFDVTWWYRTEFSLDKPLFKDQRVILTFKGISYRANVWCNGHLLGDSKTIVGAFRYFDFDVTSFIYTQGPNVIAVEISRQDDLWTPPYNSTDLGISFIDWAPFPPDNSMGLWRDVELTVLSGPVSVRYPGVETTLEWSNKADNYSQESGNFDNNCTVAHLNVHVELTNYKNSPVKGYLIGYINGVPFKQMVALNPLETRQVTFPYSNYPQLSIQQPKLWWPWQMGEQNLHNLTFVFTVFFNGYSSPSAISDRVEKELGIRQVTAKLNERGHRVYFINGKPILIRGAGWSPDLLLRKNMTRLLVEMRYVLDMNLNTIRLEGKMEHDEFFSLADKLGILVMSGWACCDAWQHWSYWGPEQYLVANESLRSELKRLRIYASNVDFFYSSDELPIEKVEKAYLAIFEEEKWPNPVLASASDRTSNITGPTGVKMSGPYSWVPPVYWLNDTSLLGGAYGFLTEGGPGENPMTYESFARTVPQDKLWPVNPEWDFHCGNEKGKFRDLRLFNPPLDTRYGASASVQEYLYKSQAATYESHRAMFEGYSLNKYVSTGVIQWMLNNAFPQMIWHLYDYYHNPGGAYYGSKKAMEAIHASYNHNDGSIWLVNSLYQPHNNLSVSADVYDFDAVLKYNQTVQVPILSSDATMNLFKLPSSLGSLTSTYFLRLTVKNSTTDEILTKNTYWLSTTPDILNWTNSTFYTTGCSSYSDFSLLEQLKPVDLVVNSTTNESVSKDSERLPLGTDKELVTEVTITNPSDRIAFMVYAKIVRSSDNEMVLPILWDDNYFTLLPGESQVIKATYNRESLNGGEPTVEVQVWNNIVPKQVTPIEI